MLVTDFEIVVQRIEFAARAELNSLLNKKNR